MSKETIEMLRKAREKLIERRNDVATSLAGEDVPNNIEGWMRAFVETQATIDRINDAIEDEEEEGEQDSDSSITSRGPAFGSRESLRLSLVQTSSSSSASSDV